jgi:hypothetical protein
MSDRETKPDSLAAAKVASGGLRLKLTGNAMSLYAHLMKQSRTKMGLFCLKVIGAA